MLAVAPDQMKLLHIDQSWCKNVNLAPIQARVNQNELFQVWVNHLLNFLSLHVAGVDSLKLIAGEDKGVKEPKLSGDLVELIP